MNTYPLSRRLSSVSLPPVGSPTAASEDSLPAVVCLIESPHNILTFNVSFSRCYSHSHWLLLETANLFFGCVCLAGQGVDENVDVLRSP